MKNNITIEIGTLSEKDIPAFVEAEMKKIKAKNAQLTSTAITIPIVPLEKS